MRQKLLALSHINDDGVVVIVRLDNAEEAFRASEAAIAGGVKALEITLSTPDALRVIERLVGAHGQTVQSERALSSTATVPTPPFPRVHRSSLVPI